MVPRRTRYGLLAVFLGLGLFGFSLGMDPYDNETVFEAGLELLEPGQSEAYFKLRDAHVTWKFWLQDMGIMILLFSLLALALSRFKWGQIVSPSHRWMFFVLAAVLPLLSAGGFVFDLGQGLQRQEFPYWADSIGIPLQGVPLILAASAGWSVAHVACVGAGRSVPMTVANVRKMNRWFLFLAFVGFVMVLPTVPFGQYWYGIPMALWVYFYLSLGLSRLPTP